jgi:hypothetical protein
MHFKQVVMMFERLKKQPVSADNRDYMAAVTAVACRRGYGSTITFLHLLTALCVDVKNTIHI